MSPTLTRLLLVRHGESVWNREQRLQGQRDPALSPQGRCQARRLARWLAAEPIAAAYASDLRRAWETARIVLAGRAVPLVPLPALREVNLGIWEGLTAAEVQERYPELWARRRADPAGYAVPGGETLTQVQARARRAVAAIVRSHPGQTVLVVTHGMVLRTLLCHWRGWPLTRVWDLPVANAALWLVESDGEADQVVRVHETAPRGEETEAGQWP